MAVLAAAANGNLTSSSTWGLVDSTTYNNSESANTALTTSFVESTGATTGIETVDGLAVKIASRSASPSGTMTVHLAIAGVEVTGSAVTVNVSDLPTCTATSGTTTPVDTAEGGWFFFKFSSPLTLAGATSYTVGAKTSSGSQVNLWSSSGTNWSRYLRTTTNQAPTTGDDIIITGEWTAAATVTARTVTMDQTAATDYGNNTTTQVTPSLAICNNGSLVWGTSASTNYILRQSGYVIIYNGGTYTQGISGTEIPRTSTATLQMDCAADGDFGIVTRKGSTLNMYGLSRTSGKNVVQTKLNADAAASATSLTLVDDTGWLSGDVVCLAPTTRTGSQFESKAATGNATSTTIAVNALTNAHSGTSPTQAEVGLLTRNNVMKGVTANVVTFLFVGSTAAISISWTEFQYISTAATGKGGIEITTTTGSCTVDSCSIHDTDSCPFRCTAASGNGFTVTNTICYNINIVNGGFNITAATSNTSWTIDHCMFCGGTNNNLVTLGDIGGTFTNCSVSGCANSGLAMSEANSMGTFSGLQVHSNSNQGIIWSATPTGTNTFTTTDIWRQGSAGQILPGTGSGQTLNFTSCNFFGNSTVNIRMSTAGSYIFANCTFNGDSTFSTPTGLDINGAGSGVVQLYSCSFSVVSGIKTQQTQDINFGNNTMFQIVNSDDCIFNGTAVYASPNSLAFPVGTAVLTAQNFGQTANDNRSYFPNGTATMGVVQSDSGTVHGTDPLSEKLTPASASVKLRTGPKYVAVDSGSTSTFSIFVQKNGSYNGNAPRLLLLRQDSMGITADTVCATFSAGANTWQQLTYTTPTAPQNGVWQFVIDCDGTAGAIFVGDPAA